MARSAPILWLLWSLWAISARAEKLFEGTGSYKSIVGIQELNHQGFFSRATNVTTEQRLRLEGTAHWNGFRLELANETSLTIQSPLRPIQPLPDGIPRAAWNTRWKLVDNDGTSLVTRLDRANLKWSDGSLALIAGKQVVALGVGHLFTAVSQTPRQPFVIVDPEYPIPEDAVTVQWEGALSVEARYLPKNPGQRSDNFHFRAKGSKGGYDLAMTAGRSDDKSFVGLETAGNLGESLLRGELILYDRNGTTLGQGLVGIDRAFNAKWSGEFEVFYSGGLVHRSSPYRGKWYSGARVRFEASQRWKLSATAIAGLNDPSVLANVNAWYSLSSSVDLGIGQFLGVGSATSEFAGQTALAPGISLGLPNFTYALMRFYF